MLQPLLLLVILIFLNAAFASAEIAVLSMNELRLKMLSEEGDKRAGKLLFLMEQPARFLATIQVAITLAGLLQSAFAAENFAGPLVTLLVDAGVGIQPSVLKSISIVVITLILAYFNLVFGELVPKRIAMKKSEGIALGLANVLYFVAKACAPVVWLLTVSTNLVLRILGMNPEEEEETVSEEEIRMLLAEGQEKGTIPTEESRMIQNVFAFDDVTVGAICTRRREVEFLEIAAPERWEDILAGDSHTYYPILAENREEVIGILDAQKYLRMRHRTSERMIRQAVTAPFFVPESVKVNALFEQMKQRRNYFAVVVDEFGQTAGIVTLYDVMELLVGDIEGHVATN